MANTLAYYSTGLTCTVNFGNICVDIVFLINLNRHLLKFLFSFFSRWAEALKLATRAEVPSLEVTQNGETKEEEGEED